MLAKTARNNPLLKLEVLFEKLSENNYKDEQLDIKVDLNEEEYTAFEFIMLLFNPEDLSGYQKHYLRFFAVLPSQEISINRLFELFEGEKKTERFYKYA